MTRDELAQALGVELRDADGCWIPNRAPNPGTGYVRLGGGHRRHAAHRAALVAVGRLTADELRPGYGPRVRVTDHLCRVRACVNPDHLDVTDQRTNVLRGVAPTAANAQRDSCPQGHPLVWWNLVPSQLRKGKRTCLECKRARRAARQAARGPVQLAYNERAAAHKRAVRAAKRLEGVA